MTGKPSLKRLTPNGRKMITLSEEKLITTSYLDHGMRLPLVLQPAVEDVNLVAWGSNNRKFIEEQLLLHGGILFRDFNVRTIAEFEQFIASLSGELLEYTYRSTPRTQVSGNIYTSTEYPSEQSIPLHNEMSYTRNWPMRICFFCLQKAEQGGATPIAKSSQVFERIDPQIRERFMTKNVMYMRNYSEGVDLPWHHVFNTTSKTIVENYCREVGMDFEWKSGNRLRTRQTCQAVAVHPKTGKLVWFNQAHLFHVSSLGPQASESLLAEFGEADLPRNAFYGDGSPIELEALDQIRRAYQQEETVFTWRDGDILMLDNMMVAHGRMPYAGARRVVVGMAEPFDGQGTKLY
jgi:alpha-ketoglutarate-dependent taurine dioxygenase